MDDISECCRILDLEPGASVEDVKRSYRELVKVWHPDRFRSDPKLQAKAEEKLKRINLAYERLCNEFAASAGRKTASSQRPRPEPERTHQEARAAQEQSGTNSQADAARARSEGTHAGVHKAKHFVRWIRKPWVTSALVAFVFIIVGVVVVPSRWGPRNEKFEQLLKAATRGDTGAQITLGKMYFSGDGVQRDKVKGAGWYQKAAAQGDANAQQFVGLLYEHGALGVEKDVAKAAEWYEKAATQGNAAVKKDLADWYAYGLGLPKDVTKAADWYEKAAAQGDAADKKELAGRYADGDGVRKDEAKAVEWHQKAAAQGDATALQELAERYADGSGVRRDQGKAAEWYEKAAAQGDAVAKRELGDKFAYGNGIPKDEAKAFEWYRKAAILGDWQAQIEIATRYDEGRGVPKDEAKAHVWYEKLRANPEYRTVNRADSAKTIERYQKAADGGDAEAQFQLGKTYEFGLGSVSKDIAKAVELYQRAAAQGHAECQHHLSLMLYRARLNGHRIGGFRQLKGWWNGKQDELQLGFGSGVFRGASGGCRCG